MKKFLRRTLFTRLREVCLTPGCYSNFPNNTFNFNIAFLFSLSSSQSWNRSDYRTSIDKYSLTHWVGRLNITVFKILSTFTRSICDNFEIPHVKTRWTVMVIKLWSHSQQQTAPFTPGQACWVLCEPGAPPQGCDPGLQGPHPRLWLEVRCCMMTLLCSVNIYFSECLQFFMKKVKPSSVFRLGFVS